MTSWVFIYIPIQIQIPTRFTSTFVA